MDAAPGPRPAQDISLDPDPDWRETIGTDLMDASLANRIVVAGNSIWPLISALAVGVIFAGLLVSLWFVPIGMVLSAIGLIGWLWPSRHEQLPPEEQEQWA